MADSKKYGRTNNLFDTSNAVIDKYVSQMGNIDNGVLPNYNFNYIKIPITPNTQYTYSFGYVVSTVDVGTYMGTHRRIIAYDSNGDFLSQIIDIQPNNNYTGEGTFTTPNNCYYISINYINTEKPNYDTNMMLNVGSTALPYQPYYSWLHSLRKLTTATEAVENPLYSDGTAITSYTIKGNTVQNGTPTPSNPVAVNGVGVRTENLWAENYVNISETLIYRAVYVGNGSFTLSSTVGVQGQSAVLFLLAGQVISGASTVNNGVWAGQNRTVTSIDGYVTIAYRAYGSVTPETADTMLNLGSTAKPFEPYGYKIPISSGGVTTNIYLGSTQTVRQIKKLVLTGQEDWNVNASTKVFYCDISHALILAEAKTSTCTHYRALGNQDNYALLLNNSCCIRWNGSVLWIRDLARSDVNDFKSYLAAQYAAGTPVTVWYVLSTPETAAVNEPLMKIGTYADTLSNAASIPTTEGANSITVDTTVQPSEFTATWTGWHNAEVKKYASDTDNLSSFPALLQASGEPLIDYTITGNTGGVAARTANYFDKNNIDTIDLYPDQETGTATQADNSWSIVIPIDFVGDGVFWLASTTPNRTRVAGYENYPVVGATSTFIDNSASTQSGYRINTFTVPANTNYLLIFLTTGQLSESELTALLQSVEVMCGQGSAKIPYVPYYCIPIQLSRAESEWEEVLINTFTDKTPQEANGLTVTVSNGSITVNGTASANTNLVLVNNSFSLGGSAYQVLDNGIYVLDGNPIDAEVNKYLLSYRYDPDGNGGVSSAVGRVGVGTSSEINNLNGAYHYFAMYVAIWKNSVLNNVVFTPSIKQKAVGTTLYIDSPLELTDTLTYTQTGIAIPTFDGDNTISFGTTVQPSAMSAEYKGWHSQDTVRVYNGNTWD